MRVSFNCMHVIMLSPKAESDATLKAEANKSEWSRMELKTSHCTHIKQHI